VPQLPEERHSLPKPKSLSEVKVVAAEVKEERIKLQQQ
jgi:hypothetical protein